MISNELKHTLLSSFNEENNLTSLIEKAEKLEDEIKNDNDFLPFFCSYLIEKAMIQSAENVISIFEHIKNSYEKESQKKGILKLLETDTLFFIMNDSKNMSDQKVIENLNCLYAMVIDFDFRAQDLVGVIINLNLLSSIDVNFNNIFNKSDDFVMELLAQSAFWDAIYQEYIDKNEGEKLTGFFSVCTPYLNEISIQNTFMESLHFSAGNIRHQRINVLLTLFDKIIPNCLLDVLKRELEKYYKEEKHLNSIYGTNPFVAFPATQPVQPAQSPQVNENETAGLMSDFQGNKP